MKTIIVTRHEGAVEWLRTRHGVEGLVIAHAAPDTVAGKIVYGILPLHLAALAAQVWSIDMPNLPAEFRGQELTPEQMDTAGACLTGYRVDRIVSPEPVPCAEVFGCTGWSKESGARRFDPLRGIEYKGRLYCSPECVEGRKRYEKACEAPSGRPESGTYASRYEGR